MAKNTRERSIVLKKNLFILPFKASMYMNYEQTNYKAKAIIEKSRGEVSLMGQDTIENVSKPIKKLKWFFKISYIFIYIKMCHKL